MKIIIINLLTIVSMSHFIMADVGMFGHIPIQDEGRIKPLDTFAENKLLSIYEKRSLKNPKIRVELDYWDWENEVLGEQDKGDPDGYLYCWVDDETKSDEEIIKIADPIWDNLIKSSNVEIFSIFISFIKFFGSREVRSGLV